MNKLLWSLCALISVGLSAQSDSGRFNPHPKSQRQLQIGAVAQITLCAEGIGHFEIVIPVKAPPVVRYAAKELSDRLFQVTGFRAEPCQQASGSVPAFLLGASAEAVALGLDPASLDRDGFYIRTDGNRILLLGQDAPGGRPERGGCLNAARCSPSMIFLSVLPVCATIFPVISVRWRHGWRS